MDGSGATDGRPMGTIAVVPAQVVVSEPHLQWWHLPPAVITPSPSPEATSVFNEGNGLRALIDFL
jgi:hypothetical protein